MESVHRLNSTDFRCNSAFPPDRSSVTRFPMALRFLLPLLFIAALSSATAGENVENSFIPRYAVATSYFTWSDESSFSNGGGTLGFLEAGAEANVPLLMKDGFRMTAGAGYRWNQLDFAGAGFPFGSTTLDLHRVDIPLNIWKDIDRKWKLWARLQPGWYSDFQSVGSDDFILTSLVLFSYQWTETTKIAFGGFYSRDLGEERVLPAVGLIYEPDPHWSLSLTFPRFELAYAPDPNFVITGGAKLAGAGWNIDDPSGAGGDVDLNYEAIEVGIGIDKRIKGPWWAYLDAGMKVGQEIEIEGAPYRYRQELDSAPFVSAGVKMRR